MGRSPPPPPFPLRRLGLGLKPPRFKTAYLRNHVKGQVAIEGDFVWQGDPELVLNLKPVPRKLGPASVVLQLVSGLIRLQVRLARMHPPSAHVCLPQCCIQLQPWAQPQAQLQLSSPVANAGRHQLTGADGEVLRLPLPGPARQAPPGRPAGAPPALGGRTPAMPIHQRQLPGGCTASRSSLPVRA